MQSESTSNDFTSNSDPIGSGRSTDKDLEIQVSRLREDVAGVAEALKSLASERADGARRQAFALRDDVRDRGERYLQQAQEAASEFEAEISERVRAEPIKAVLIAAAAGYIYARLFR
jgi:ElaB/YqjD/DUF883 family membrane-anchored ribosome-binding protein